MTISSNAATVSGDINSIEGALLSSRSTNEGGSLTLINPTKQDPNIIHGFFTI